MLSENLPSSQSWTSNDTTSQPIQSLVTKHPSGKRTLIQELFNEQPNSRTDTSEGVPDEDDALTTGSEGSCISIDVMQRLAAEVGSTIDREPLDIHQKLQEYRNRGECDVDLEDIDD